MNFCFVGHIFHTKSRSTTFFIEILRELGNVDAFTSNPDADPSEDDELVARLAGSRYDCYIFFQTEYLAERVRNFGLGRFVIIPMYDGAMGWPDAFWRQFVNATFISFCRKHHEHLESLDCRSVCFRYFPAVPPVKERDTNLRSAFFWARRPDLRIDVDLVLDLCRQLEIAALHVHTASDFARHSRVNTIKLSAMPDGAPAVTHSSWFESQEDYHAVAAEPLFYFAPREFEGIGTAVLEAMARGQIVVAPDRATSNEYVSHMVSGLLYEPDKPVIGPSPGAEDLARMSWTSRLKAEFGRAEWEQDIVRLKSILLDDGRRWATRDDASHFLNSLRAGASARAFASGDGRAR